MIGKGLIRRPWVRVFGLALSVLTIFSVTYSTAKADEDDKLKRGEFIPTGVHITPLAAKGSIFQPLNPGLVSDPSFTVGQPVPPPVSPHGKTLLLLPSAYNTPTFTSPPNPRNTNPPQPT